MTALFSSDLDTFTTPKASVLSQLMVNRGDPGDTRARATGIPSNERGGYKDSTRCANCSTRTGGARTSVLRWL